MITRVDYKVPEITFDITQDNLKDFFVADVHGGRKFLLNDGGYPMNDIDMILRQQDASVRESLVKGLDEIPTTGVPSDTPNTEVLLGLRSRYQQTPSEMVRFYEKQLEIAQSRAESVQQQESFEFKPSDVPDVVDNV